MSGKKGLAAGFLLGRGGAPSTRPNSTPTGDDDSRRLREAARNVHTATVTELVRLGANVEAADNMAGLTSLMMAAHLGQTATVTELVRLGADMNARRPGGRTLLDITRDVSTAAEIRRLQAASRGGRVRPRRPPPRCRE